MRFFRLGKSLRGIPSYNIIILDHKTYIFSNSLFSGFIGIGSVRNIFSRNVPFFFTFYYRIRGLVILFIIYITMVFVMRGFVVIGMHFGMVFVMEVWMVTVVRWVIFVFSFVGFFLLFVLIFQIFMVS